jgi:hypothetical protein
MNFDNGCCVPIFGLFIRKLKNKSGSISVQIIAKTSGKYRVVKTSAIVTVRKGNFVEIMR